MKRIFSYFLQGIVLIAPTAIIVFILYSLFMKIDSWVASNIEKVIGFSVPGLGILFLFITLTLLGFLGQTAIVRPIQRMAEKVIKRIPLLHLLYSSFNDLFSAFVGKEKKFNTPVKVFFNKENNLYKLGFITKESMEEIGNEELAAVYFPHSYNFSGELYLVPNDRIEKIDLPPAEMMKFIVSAGITRVETID